tara:strand:+ start:8408 stop:8830 length:423 start_codon:yes stop_codon:yes gene_type:complete
MKKNEPIKNIMSSKLVFATINSKISEVKSLMQENHIHHVPVVSGKKLIGLVSRVDLLRSSFSDLFVKEDKASADQLDSVASIEDVMTRDIKTLSVSSSVRDAALILLGNDFNSLPIIDSNEELAGIVTSKDITRYLIEQL